MTTRMEATQLRSAPAVPPASLARLREALRHCSPDTYEAACAVRMTGDPASLHALVTGLLGNFVSGDLQHRLTEGGPGLRLAEDLGLDSLDLTELGMLSEEVLLVSISNDDLFAIRTLADLESLFERLLRSQPRPEMRHPADRTLRPAPLRGPLPDRAAASQHR